MAIATNILQCLIPISQIEATKRIEDNGNKETVSMDYVMRNLGIDEKELENAEDIDIE